MALPTNADRQTDRQTDRQRLFIVYAVIITIITLGHGDLRQSGITLLVTSRNPREDCTCMHDDSTPTPTTATPTSV